MGSCEPFSPNVAGYLSHKLLSKWVEQLLVPPADSTASNKAIFVEMVTPCLGRFVSQGNTLASFYSFFAARSFCCLIFLPLCCSCCCHHHKLVKLLTKEQITVELCTMCYTWKSDWSHQSWHQRKRKAIARSQAKNTNNGQLKNNVSKSQKHTLDPFKNNHSYESDDNDSESDRKNGAFAIHSSITNNIVY